MKIVLKDKFTGTIVRTWNLDRSNYPDEIAVANGIDRWVKITIKENAIKSGCIDFNFNWVWDNENVNIDLNEG